MKMTFFMRLNKGSIKKVPQWVTGGGVVNRVCYLDEDTHQYAIEDYISKEVIDKIAYPPGLPDDDHYCFCVSSATNNRDQDDPAIILNHPDLHCRPIFTLMDIELTIDTDHTWSESDGRPRSEQCALSPCDYVLDLSSCD
jgi:hypothetical protein